MSQTRRHRRGFTLIEAMIVVAIVGIAASLGIASLQPVIADVRLHGTTRGAAALIRAARLQAMSRHERVEVSATAARFVVAACPARFAAPGCAAGTALAAVSGQSVSLGEGDALGVRLQSGPADTLVFGPNGLPEGAATLRQYVLANDARSRQIEVSPAGEVRVR
jgi:prepilin-type N-terminal cleavage/methylation domain-containing protein